MLKGKSRLEKPVFLVGCMRSGTTMLADLLGKHPNIIHCPFELRSIWSKAGRVPMASPRTGDKRCPHLDRSDARPIQARNLTNAFLAEMQKYRAEKNRNAVFLNKNPHLCNKLPFVDELFPDARFIWIYRHLPSVVASLKKLLDFDEIHYWPAKNDPDTVRCWHCFFGRVPGHIERSRCFPGGDVTYLAEYWYETNKAVSDFAKTIRADRIMFVQEEELVANPERVLGSCMSFLDLPVIIPKRKMAKLDLDRNKAWKKRLSKDDVECLSRFINEYGNRLNDVFPEGDLFRFYQQEIEECL